MALPLSVASLFLVLIVVSGDILIIVFELRLGFRFFPIEGTLVEVFAHV